MHKNIHEMMDKYDRKERKKKKERLRGLSCIVGLPAQTRLFVFSLTFCCFWLNSDPFQPFFLAIVMATPSVILSSDDVAKTPPGVSQVPLSVKFSPDGTLLTYLFPNHHGVRQVYAVDLTKKQGEYEPYKLFDATTAGSGTDSLAEQLRKERMRLFVNGVSQYEWATQQEGNSHSRRIMLPLHGSVLLYDSNATESQSGNAQSPLQVLYDTATTGESAVDPQLSPKGNVVAFVLNDDLYVQYLSSTNTPTSPPVRITTSGNINGVSCGVADFIAQEEMDRYHGFWWSPCGTMIVYTEVDENVVPTFDILHQVTTLTFPTPFDTHTYMHTFVYIYAHLHILADV